MDNLEIALKDSVRHDDSFLDEVALHLIEAGGKRLRPALTLVSSLLGSAENDASATKDVITGAVSVELVHLASLYHDDVMDEALTRRTVESVNARWGNLVAIVAGDYLLARSAEIAASLGSEVAQLLAAALGKLCAGQVAEVNSTFKPDRSIEAYENAISGKTASLMATACHIGSLVGQVDREFIPKITEYGHDLGMAFQIRDDILDIASNFEDLGKIPGQDLAEGIYTLPTILTLKDPKFKEDLKILLGKPLDEGSQKLAKDIVLESGSVEQSFEIAKLYIDKSVAALSVVPDTSAKISLINLASSLLDGVIPDSTSQLT